MVFTFITSQSSAQQYTADFATAPTLLPSKVFAGWKDAAEVVLGGDTYIFTHIGNDTWAHIGSGGVGNSACLTYSPSSDATVTIKRKDGARFQFYGAYARYTNSVGGL